MVSERKSWIPGHVRAEKVLTDAITIDGRKEWICKFCFRDRCVDAAALQALWGPHPYGPARQAQPGDVREE